MSPFQFSQLPDELLCLIFEHCPSLPQMFKLARVNGKFRRCITTLLAKPRVLKLDFDEGAINGHKIRLHNWPAAVQVLAQRTQFSQIIVDGASRKGKAVFNAILKSDCLNQLTVLDAANMDLAVINKVIENCPELSVLQYQAVKPTHLSVLKLSDALRDKTMTEIDLFLPMFGCYQQELLNIFSNLRPNALKKVALFFEKFEGETMAVFKLSQLFVALSQGPWAAVESLDFGFRATHAISDRNKLLALEMFRALGEFPVLRYCCIRGIMFGTLEELFQSISLHESPPTPLLIEFKSIHHRQSCHLISELLKLKNAQIEVQGISSGEASMLPTPYWVTFCTQFILQIASENLTVRVGVNSIACDEFCDLCARFYPNFLWILSRVAKLGLSGHLRLVTLDRCKIQRVKQDLERFDCPNVTDLSLNEAEDTAIVSFDNNSIITIDCGGQCYNTSCIGCLAI